jgi:hypothetical protein
MITLTREETQQVLKVLEYPGPSWPESRTELAVALRYKLSAPEPEPVAYGVLDDDGQIDWTAEYPFSNEPGWPDSVPLYTAPPQRDVTSAKAAEWQGLTDEEKQTAYAMFSTMSAIGFVQAIEAKLKEKNYDKY